MKDADRIVVLDGHDGAGKSSLCAHLAAKHGGHVIKPFNDSLGDLIGWLWGRGRFVESEQVALLAIERELANAPSQGLLFFDRHWLSLYTVLPEAQFPRWEPRPFTILCWADLPTTIERLTARGEEVGDLDEHRHYIELYAILARRFDVPIVDTTRMTLSRATEAIEDLMEANPVFKR